MKYSHIPAGARYGMLTVMEDRVPGARRILVRCDCGKAVSISISNLQKNLPNRSCGCLVPMGERATRHGHSPRGGLRSPTYNTWAMMVTRCHNPNFPCYADYGGRGITVCARWRVFENFLADMGTRPDGRTIDRIDNEQGYFPGNCRWATPSEQSLNRRKGWAKGRKPGSRGKAKGAVGKG